MHKKWTWFVCIHCKEFVPKKSYVYVWFILRTCFKHKPVFLMDKLQQPLELKKQLIEGSDPMKPTVVPHNSPLSKQKQWRVSTCMLSYYLGHAPGFHYCDYYSQVPSKMYSPFFLWDHQIFNQNWMTTKKSFFSKFALLTLSLLEKFKSNETKYEWNCIFITNHLSIHSFRLLGR